MTDNSGEIVTLCERCNLDRHRCHGCGTAVPHGRVACAECSVESRPWCCDRPHQDTQLCDIDGTVRRGAMHKGTDYSCTGSAHYGGWHINCTGPAHSGSEGAAS